MKVYLDTCLLIYLLEGEAIISAAVQAAIEQYPKAEFCTSPLVRLECLVHPIQTADQVLLGEYEQLLASLTLLEMPLEVYEKAAQHRAKNKLKTPDALHLATAEHGGCTELWTNDTRLSKSGSSLVFRVLP